MKRVFLSVCAAALMFGCFESNPVGGGDLIPSSSILVQTMTYSLNVVGDSLTVISTSTECNGTTLVTSIDTSKSKIVVTATTAIKTKGTQIDTLTRLGTGTGIQGSWTQKMEGVGIGYVRIGATTIQTYVPKATLMSLMKSGLLSEINNPGITIDTSNAERFVMTGVTTHEVVTLSINNSGQLIWSSSVAANAAKTVTLFNITTCPNDVNPPTWFTPFLTGNVTGVPKIKALNLEVGPLNF